MKITGLGDLNKNIEQAKKALSELDGNIGKVRFDPEDPASIEQAINSAELMIDEKLGSYSSNPIIKPLISGMKEKYREYIIDQASAARLKGNNDGK